MLAPSVVAGTERCLNSNMEMILSKDFAGSMYQFEGAELIAVGNRGCLRENKVYDI